MNRAIHVFTSAVMLAALLCLTACNRTKKPRLPSGPKIEKREDGLYYEVGLLMPFNGTVKRYDKTTGAKVYECDYEKGKKDGWERRWFAEKPEQIYTQSFWVQGGPTFHWKFWPNGNLRELSSQRAGQDMGRPDIGFGTFLKFFEDGRLKFKAHYDEQFRWHGHVIDYDDQGVLMWDAIFDRGVAVSGKVPPGETIPKSPQPK